jgi:hypothetical protein
VNIGPASGATFKISIVTATMATGERLRRDEDAQGVTEVFEVTPAGFNGQSLHYLTHSCAPAPGAGGAIVLLYLHGASGRGNGGECFDARVCGQVLPTIFAHCPQSVIVVAPQCPKSLPRVPKYVTLTRARVGTKTWVLTLTAYRF